MVELLTELLVRCRRGEPDAAAILIGRFQAMAGDLANALLGDAHLAEDAVQASFVRALTSLADLRQDAAFPGWLRQIVRTECNRINRRKHEASLGDADPPTLGGSPPEMATLAERGRLVREALAALPRVGREAAELFYLEERGCAEVAEVLGIPEGTVKRRLHDARTRLRDMLLGLADPVRPGKTVKRGKIRRSDLPPI